MAINLKKELNDRQYQAASTLDGPVLIIAGAGSGKTRMITYRIAHMLEQGIAQSNILALTFTNKAATEMAERVRQLTRSPLPKLTTSTFHAFGVQVLRSKIDHLGFDHNFTIYDQADKSAMIKGIVRDLHIPLESIDLYELSNLFSAIKTGRTSWSNENRSYEKIYEEYNLHLKAYNAVDFDDLITLPIKLFETFPGVLQAYRDRYTYIMVDEFQDTSLVQYRLLNLLASESRNICVVGDDDQSIYSWRGASYENIVRFERDFPEVKEIMLEQNYRSTGNILHAANTVIANNTKRKSKELWTGSEKGNSISIFHPEDEEHEADFICSTIKQIGFDEQVSYDDMGVLVRTNSLLATLEQEFLSQQIPYTVSGGQSFFSRKEIKDIIAYMRLLTNPDDDVNFLRIINTPRRGIGRVSLEQLRSYAKSHHMSLFSAVSKMAHDPDAPVADRLHGICESFTELIEEYKQKIFSKKNMAHSMKGLIAAIDYRSYLIGEHPENERLVKWKLKNVEIFLDMFQRWENDPDNLKPNIYDYLNRITLNTSDTKEKEQGKINLMTIHASKGLEFNTVFLAGVEDHIIPHARSIEEDEHNLEEERRLFYVAITRAKQSLVITSCRQRKYLREVITSTPSRFLQEIPVDLLAHVQEDEELSMADSLKKLQALRARMSS